MKNADKWAEWFPSGWRLFAALRNFTQFLPTPIQYSWDPVVWWTKGKTTRKAIAGQRDYHMGNTARYVAEKSLGHPCPRPLDTVQYVVRLASEDAAIILDPFAGSGTTGVAAILEGRKAILIEKDAGYVEVIKRRIKHALCESPSQLPFKQPALVEV